MAPASCCARSSRPTKTRPTVALGHLSDETVRRRFLAAKPRFSSGELRYLTEVDGHDHVAIVALLSDDPETIVGVARCVRLPGAPDTAEFAIVVADGLQGRRLGTLLARTLADAARAGPGGAAGTWSSGFPRVLHSGMVARAPLCSRRRWTLPFVAEGVETGVQALFLAAQRCDQAQGRHFGEPIPGAEMTAACGMRPRTEATGPCGR